MYEVLILLVLVNLGFTNYIWRTIRRGPKRKFGKPITPKHGAVGLGGVLVPVCIGILDEESLFRELPAPKPKLRLGDR